MPKPVVTIDYNEWYASYINKIEADNIADIITKYKETIEDFYNSLPEEKADYAYAPGKWTIKDLLQHVIDAERVFTYRILRFSRKDETPLHSFDEDEYALQGMAALRTLDSLKREFTMLRAATDIMLLNLTEAQLQLKGNAAGKPVTVNAIPFIIYGHLLHHMQVIQERYL